MPEIALKYWHAIIGIIAIIVWLVRIEARTLANARDSDKRDEAVRRELTHMEARFDKQRAEDLARRQERDARIDERLDEIARDIKELLKRQVL